MIIIPTSCFVLLRFDDSFEIMKKLHIYCMNILPGTYMTNERKKKVSEGHTKLTPDQPNTYDSERT